MATKKQKESESASEPRAASQRDTTHGVQGSTPGGASESQQPRAIARGETLGGLPGTGERVVPEPDSAIAGGIVPRPATPRSPGLDYDDDARG